MRQSGSPDQILQRLSVFDTGVAELFEQRLTGTQTRQHEIG